MIKISVSLKSEILEQTSLLVAGGETDDVASTGETMLLILSCRQINFPSVKIY